MRMAWCLWSALLMAGCAAVQESERGSQRAKNVILFVGDGMGVSTVTAARIFDGQSRGEPGEENLLSFERFPHVALVKTYNTNQQVPDSAGTATAMASGRKTRAGMINVGPQVLRQSCAGAKRHAQRPIGDIAKARGKAVGVVSNTTITHATPAAVYAITPERGWEGDAEMPNSAIEEGCRDIAHQLVHRQPAADLDVILGGGREFFFGSNHGGSRREQNADLVAEWLARGAERRFVSSAAELREQTPSGPLFGLFTSGHMTFVAERTDETSEPTLSEMTAAAIDQLATHDAGYFLMVEGGRIDHGHHAGRAGYALLETQAFAEAVQVAVDRVDGQDTLILVTADHSHVFAIAGYPVRGNPILGHVVENDAQGEPESTPAVDANGVPYNTLGYVNGPGAVLRLPRPTPDTGVSAVTQALIPTGFRLPDGRMVAIETHAGEDVALYGTGPGSHRVRGVIEQNVIFDIMMAAFGWD